MRLTCLGECLAPAIGNGTTIEVESDKPEAILCGDLVVFSSRGVYTCHRVLYRKQEEELWWYFLKADNTGVPDGWIPYYRVLGKVTKVGQAPRPTRETRRDDVRRLWRSRLGYAVYASRLTGRLLQRSLLGRAMHG